MTLPSLLRKVGIEVPRHVTVDGRVVLDRQVSDGTIPHDATAMRPHRFHGGEDPAPRKVDSEQAWWLSDATAKDADVTDMRKRFRHVIVLDEGDELAYGVTFDTGRGLFEALILPQADRSLPSVFVTRPKSLGRKEGRRYRRPPHVYTSGAICVADVSDWPGRSYGTSVAAAWTAHWLACYTEWRMSGVWPTAGYGKHVE